MPIKPAKWPTYALGTLEDVQAIAFDIDKMGRDIQIAVRDNRREDAVIIASDIRALANGIRMRLVEARSGDYSKEPEQ